MLGLSSNYFDFPDQLRSLSKAKHRGFLAAIPALADKAAATLAPVDPQALLDRLTMLGMSMAHGKTPEEQRAWLHETARLLGDLPESILFDAIDECVKEPGRVFAPAVGEIREKASGPLHEKERAAARLRRYANLIAEGVDIPEWVEPTSPQWSVPQQPKKICTPEEARAILVEYGLRGTVAESVAGMLKPDHPKSRAELIAEGKEPPPLPTQADESDGWEMMP